MKKLILIVLSVMMLLCGVVHAQHIDYVSMEVPAINSSFKSFMGEHKMKKSAPQHKFLEEWGYVDENGLYRCKAEADFGVTDDYYLVAMGSYYSRNIGDKFRITTDRGNVFYVALTEFKADIHTDRKHQYGKNNKDILEFIIDKKTLLPIVRKMGSCNVLAPLKGSIVKVEKMNFIHDEERS